MHLVLHHGGGDAASPGQGAVHLGAWQQLDEVELGIVLLDEVKHRQHLARADEIVGGEAGAVGQGGVAKVNAVLGQDGAHRHGAAAIAARLVVVVTPHGFEEGIGVEVVGLFQHLGEHHRQGDRVVGRQGLGTDRGLMGDPQQAVVADPGAVHGPADVVPAPGLHVMDGKAQPLWLLVRGDAALELVEVALGHVYFQSAELTRHVAIAHHLHVVGADADGHAGGHVAHRRLANLGGGDGAVGAVLVDDDRGDGSGEAEGLIPPGPAVATLIAVVGTGVDIDVALNAGDAQLFEQGNQIHARQGRVADEVDPDVAVDGGALFGAGLGLDVGGEAEVGTEFEACSERGEHLHGGGGGYHVIGVTGKFHPVVALYDDGVLAPLGRGQRGGVDRQRKESTKTNQQPLHRIL